MRIQHNIMAMNAYRNYTNNVSAMKQNLEKLSSGYKINRAGDDAAGLAISEKMRAQITGLQTAQKNAKDGISLVQTAEGALTEVHDMLNRMVELASQSANGTYDNQTDRYQLQKEMDQLTSEIDRIADSANFNGIKLLDGSMDASTKTSVKYSDINNKAVGTAAILPKKTDAQEAGVVGSNTITYKENGEPVKTKFAVDLGGVAWKVDDTDLDNVKLTVQFPTSVGATIVGGVDVGTRPAQISFTYSKDELSGCLDENGQVNMNEFMKLVDTDLKTVTDKDGDGHGGHMKIDIAGITKDGDTTYSGFDVSVDGTKLVFELCDLASAQEAETQANWGDIRVTTKATYTEASGKDPVENAGSDGFVGWNVGATEMVKGVLPGDDRMANTVLDMSKAGFKTGAADAAKNDGWSITIDGKSYILAVGDSDISKYSGNAVVVKVDKDATVDDQLRELANAINNGSSTWSVGANQKSVTNTTVDGDHGTFYGLTFAQIAKTSDEDLTTVEGIAKAIKVGKVSASTTTTKGVGKSLTLQIGDTAESFNQLKVDVADCHAKALGIGDVDISTQDGAAAAIEKIKAAINKVSDVRGTLGATQNRLDHTINNLSVMTENIQDAESTIRDVDVAEEMMAYTKNNILIQSAQAMLAQANQVPQGVLQLLQ